MTSLVVGTAGHIDHGKSTLVEALTGTDPDRLQEEKARGITIDLGFAHLAIGDVDVAFVDVPGHERFVRNMLAGAGGIDAVLLVIAADESIMPQTREHADICRLLGVDRAVVALTKSDLVDADALELVALEAADLLAGTAMAGGAVVPVSARTGAGLDALRTAIAALATRPRERRREGIVRLPVDRAFSMKGHGTIVTGTLVSGRISVGDSLIAQPEGLPVRARGVQVHGRAADHVVAPHRVALNLGATDRTRLARGVTIASADAATVTRRADLDVELLPGARPLKQGARVRVHHGTSALAGRVSIAAWGPNAGDPPSPVAAGAEGVEVPGGARAFVRVRLERPAFLTRGDRLVLRAFSPVATIGGGVVLDPEAPRGRVRREESYRRFLGLAEGALPTALWLDPDDARGVDEGTLVRRWGAAPADARVMCESAVAGGVAVAVGRRLFAASLASRMAAAIGAALETFHAAQPLEPGLSRSTLREETAPDAPVAFFDHVVAGLASAGLLTGADRLALRSHTRASGASADPVRTRLIEIARDAGLAAFDTQGFVGAAGEPLPEVDPRLRALLREGALIKVGPFLYERAVLERLKRDLKAANGAGAAGEVEVGAFKERFGLTRKHAIPLLEWLDRERVTRRVGATRRLV